MTAERILAVGAHPDDVFLSIGGFLKNRIKEGAEVTILDVYGDEKRIQEGTVYAASINALQYVNLGLKESGSPTEYPVQSIQGITLDKVLSLVNISDLILLPLGIVHEEHIMVSRQLTFVCKSLEANYAYYLDQPYALMQKNQEEVEDRLRGKMIMHYVRPHASKYNAAKLFKSQSLFMYYNREKFTDIFELIVSSGQVI